VVRALFDAGGGRIALITTEQAIWLFAADGTPIRRLAEVPGRNGPQPVHQSGILDVAIAPDGRYLVSVDEDGQAVRWDLGEEASALVLGQHEQSVTSVRISPDGRQALTASLDGTARLWDLDSGRETAVFIHDGAVTEAGFSADGERAFTLSTEDGSARLWGLEPVSRLALRLPHPDHVVYVQFGPRRVDGGVQLATAGYDGKVRVWDLSRAGAEAPAEPALVLTGHAGPVRRLAYSADGQRLVSSGQDGTARIWELGDGSGRE
jgi:WD40 repeat protein